MTNWKRTIKGIPESIEIAENIGLSEYLINIVAILKLQPEYEEYGGELWEIVDEMEFSANEGELDGTHYNALLSAMYDWADVEKIWIEP